MKNGKLSIYFVIADISLFIFIGIGHFVKLPDLLSGFCAGTTIAMCLVGIYDQKHDINKLRNFKRKLIGLPIK